MNGRVHIRAMEGNDDSRWQNCLQPNLARTVGCLLEVLFPLSFENVLTVAWTRLAQFLPSQQI
jgi:hypothetical protein